MSSNGPSEFNEKVKEYTGALSMMIMVDPVRIVAKYQGVISTAVFDFDYINKHIEVNTQDNVFKHPTHGFAIDRRKLKKVRNLEGCKMLKEGEYVLIRDSKLQAEIIDWLKGLSGADKIKLAAEVSEHIEELEKAAKTIKEMQSDGHNLDFMDAAFLISAGTGVLFTLAYLSSFIGEVDRESLSDRQEYLGLMMYSAGAIGGILEVRLAQMLRKEGLQKTIDAIKSTVFGTVVENATPASIVSSKPKPEKASAGEARDALQAALSSATKPKKAEILKSLFSSEMNQKLKSGLKK